MDNKEIELFKEEIFELTELLKEDWLDLRNLIEQSGLEVQNLFLISYTEDESESEYGVLFTDKREVIEFKVYDEKIELIDITNVIEKEKEFPQIKIAKDFFYI